ncbi:MAG: cysteine hydrolase [Lachnospiraceae bacterium]|nr:cysteine hydrolase [Lachnospiraceae bacterium]
MKILIVIDMQNDFIDMALGTKEAVSIVPGVASKITDGNWDKIYVTYDTHGENYMETSEGKNLPVPHCIKGSKGWELNGEVEAALSKVACPVVRVEKPTFGSVQLAALIGEDCKATECTVELVGLCTDICVVSNALLLKANYPELPISLDSSCVAAVTPESNEAALTTMKMCQIHIK